MTPPRGPALDRLSAVAGPLRSQTLTLGDGATFEAALVRSTDQDGRRPSAEPMFTNPGKRPIHIDGELAPEDGSMRVTPRRTPRDRRAVPTSPTEPDTLDKSAPTSKTHDSRDQQIPWIPHRGPEQRLPHGIGPQIAIPTDPPPPAGARSFGTEFARDEAATAVHAPPIERRTGGLSVSHRETHFAPVRFKMSEPTLARSSIDDRTPEGLESQAAKGAPSRGGAGRSPVATAESAGPSTALSPVPEPAPPPGSAVLEPPAAQVVAAIIDHCSTPGETQSNALPRIAPPEVAFNATQPLRIIRLQLSPATLGTVDIQLTMEQDALRVHLDAQSASTAVSLERDRTALVDQLTSSGHLLADVHIGQAPPRAGGDASHTRGTDPNIASSNPSAGGSDQTPHGGRDARANHSTPFPEGCEAKTPDQRSPSARDRWSANSRISPYAEVRVLRLL